MTEEMQEDFGALLEQFSTAKSLRLNVGDKVRGKIFQIAKDTAFVELSPSQEASIPREDLCNKEGELTAKVGDTLEAYVVNLRDGIELRRHIGKGQVDIEMLEEARASGMPIDGTVTGVNKGGLEVLIGGARGFCPIGQADITFVPDPSVFVGKTFQFVIKEVREHGRNVVLSRRALLEVEQHERAKKLMDTLAPGARVEGKVTRLAEFGVFVDIGGIEGLVPMSELSFARVEKSSDVATVGDTVTVEVRRIEEDPKRPGKQRISLSLKATMPDPFVAHADDLREGNTLTGTVAKLEKFGAFVELLPGIQGLVHISEVADRRIRHPSDVLKVGESVTVKVLSFNPAERRVSLSIKATGAQPPAPGDTAVGALVVGKVERLEKYGVFVKLDTGATALLPAAETGTPPNTDLAKHFPIGSEHPLVVLSMDERGRLKVSKKARDQAEERAVMDSYNKSQGGGAQSFGTLGDLLKKQQPAKK